MVMQQICWSIWNELDHNFETRYCGVSLYVRKQEELYIAGRKGSALLSTSGEKALNSRGERLTEVRLAADNLGGCCKTYHWVVSCT